MTPEISYYGIRLAPRNGDTRSYGEIMEEVRTMLARQTKLTLTLEPPSYQHSDGSFAHIVVAPPDIPLSTVHDAMRRACIPRHVGSLLAYDESFRTFLADARAGKEVILSPPSLSAKHRA
jgi:hypothetical protein